MLGPAAEPDGGYRAWPIPTAYSPESLVDLGGRVLYRATPPASSTAMTGEGIAQALESGRLAAGSIVQGGGQLGRGRDPYPPLRRPGAGPRPPIRRRCSRRRTRATARHQRGHPNRRIVAVDAPQLRPLDVRGLSTRRRLHAGSGSAPGALTGAGAHRSQTERSYELARITIFVRLTAEPGRRTTSSPHSCRSSKPPRPSRAPRFSRCTRGA